MTPVSGVSSVSGDGSWNVTKFSPSCCYCVGALVETLNFPVVQYAIAIHGNKMLQASDEVKAVLDNLSTCIFRGPSVAMEAWLMRRCIRTLVHERGARLEQMLTDGDLHSEHILNDEAPGTAQGRCGNHRVRAACRTQDTFAQVKRLTAAKTAKWRTLIRNLPQLIARCGVHWSPWRSWVRELEGYVSSDAFVCDCIGCPPGCKQDHVHHKGRHRWEECPPDCSIDHVHKVSCGCARSPLHTKWLARCMNSTMRQSQNYNEFCTRVLQCCRYHSNGVHSWRETPDLAQAEAKGDLPDVGCIFCGKVFKGEAACLEHVADVHRPASCPRDSPPPESGVDATCYWHDTPDDARSTSPTMKCRFHKTCWQLLLLELLRDVHQFFIKGENLACLNTNARESGFGYRMSSGVMGGKRKNIGACTLAVNGMQIVAKANRVAMHVIRGGT